MKGKYVMVNFGMSAILLKGFIHKIMLGRKYSTQVKPDIPTTYGTTGVITYE
jgi:hypothetical protein